MSNKRLTAVWDLSKQSGVKLLALLSLADRADDDGYCWPSHKDTAQRTRSARTYILAILREIAADGELYIHATSGSTHKYIVLPGMTEEEIRKALIRRFDYTEEDAEYKVSVIRTCQLSRQGVSVQQTGRVSVQQTGGVSSTEHEPSLTTKKRTQKKRKVAPSGASPADPPAEPPAETIRISNELRKFAQDVFHEATGLEPLPATSKKNKSSNASRWWDPLRSICEIGQADRDYIRALIEGAVKDLSPDYISAPQSILNTIPKIKAKLNGSHKAAQPQYREVYE